MSEPTEVVTYPAIKSLPRVMMRETVADLLRQMIIFGQIDVGKRLHQGSLAKQLGISRTPLREALHKLSVEGLVVFDATNNTASVVKPSVEQLTETYEIREMLEVRAGRQAAAMSTPEHCMKAQDIVDAMKGVDDPTEWATLNAAFHSAVYEVTGKKQMLELIELMRNRAKLYVTILATDLPNKQHAAKEHQDMVDALRGHDADAMEGIIRRHLNNTALIVGTELSR